MPRAALLLIFVIVPTAAAQDAAQAVVKKAIDAHGGAEALNKSKTARAKTEGTMVMANVGEVKFLSTAVYSLPDKFKLDLAAEVRGLKMTAKQVINGKAVTVKSTLGGVDQPIDAKASAEAAQAVQLQEITTLTPLVEGTKYTLKSEGDAAIDGKPMAVVMVSGKDVRDVRLYFNKETGLLTRTVRRTLANTDKGITEVTEESTLSEFKKTDGALLPTKVTVTHDGKKFMDVTVTETKFADKIEASEFEAGK